MEDKTAYYFSKTLPVGFDEAVRRTTEALKQEGIGIITKIDVKETFKKKRGIDFRNYRILGACNPALSHEALNLEDKIGSMLPYNVSDISLAADPAINFRINVAGKGKLVITARGSDNAVSERSFDLEQQGS